MNFGDVKFQIFVSNEEDFYQHDESPYSYSWKHKATFDTEFSNINLGSCKGTRVTKLAF